MILNMKGNNLKFYKSEEKIKCSIHNRRENYMHYYYNNIADWIVYELFILKLKIVVILH